ncbi:MAG TPA: copper-containing nitrite reductase [Dehalococcoidia bacterium]
MEMTGRGAALGLGAALLLLSVAAACRDGGTTATTETPVEARPAAADAVRVARDPADVPPPPGNRGPETVAVHLETVELTGTLDDGTTYAYWTFNGTVPGPLIRVRQGDTVELFLKNREGSGQVHSIDLHAVNGPGGGAGATQVKPGEEKGFRFRALNPGVYVYHCATPYIPQHLANGMYGLIIVEPPEGLPPVDREFYVMQGEFYTDLPAGRAGHATFDGNALTAEAPNYVVFNGQRQAITGPHAMQAQAGERVRIFVGNGGPNLVSSFHVIGEVFDVVHHEGATDADRNVQTTLIPAGGAAWVEFTVDVPGDYLLVDHALSRALGKGAVATLHVEGAPNAEVFSAPGAAPGSGH